MTTNPDVGLPETVAITIARPRFHAETTGMLTVVEHEGSVWLWAAPQLLIWPRDVVWIFTLVSSERRDGKCLAGDLWGLDADGDLLILENKPTTRKDNPFDHFCENSSLRTSPAARCSASVRNLGFCRTPRSARHCIAGQSFTLTC
jgi:hypothetical protein